MLMNLIFAHFCSLFFISVSWHRHRGRAKEGLRAEWQIGVKFLQRLPLLHFSDAEVLDVFCTCFGVLHAK